MLAQLCPEEYAEPPAPRSPAVALTREARIAVMTARDNRGVGLYHPGDLWRRPDVAEQVGVRPDSKNPGAAEALVIEGGGKHGHVRSNVG